MATSGVTFSGFNDIDFNVVLNAIMDQESQPLTALQTRQAELQKTDSNYALLATKLSALKTAAADLSGSTSFVKYSAASSDSTALSVSASSSAVAGRYDVVVNELARAQTTVSSSWSADTDTTIVATGGSLMIGGQTISVAGPLTLRQLADQINSNSDAPATAAIVETAPGVFRLVLSSKDTGAAHAFTVQNGLTGSSIAFTDTDNDNISGDSAADNSVNATDASVLINNILVTSSSNTLEAGIPGVVVTLQQKDPAKTVVVTVGRDDSDLASRVDKFVAAYNDLNKFATDQGTAAGKGTTGTLGRDALLRSLRSQLRDSLAGAHGSAAVSHLAEVGIGFSRTGQLTFDRTAFTTALHDHPAAVQSLFSDATTGVFKNVGALVQSYTESGGFVPGARTRVSEELSRLGRRMDDMSQRLAVRRRSLQQTFIAADLAMTRLKGQQSALGSYATNISTPL